MKVNGFMVTCLSSMGHLSKFLTKSPSFMSRYCSPRSSACVIIVLLSESLSDTIPLNSSYLSREEYQMLFSAAYRRSGSLARVAL